MFELPDAKRVRREELNGSVDSGDSDSEVDTEARAQLEAQIARSLGLEDGDSLKPSPPPTHDGPSSKDVVMENSEAPQNEGQEDSDAGQEEYDFCLFGGSGATATKVVLEDDTEDQGEGGIVARRDLSCYVAPDYTEQQKQMFRTAAVTGEDVLARSNWRAWALEMPWKVTHITVTRKGDKVVPEEDEAEEAKRKRRPGKKRRIAMRMKERAQKDKAQAAKQTAAKQKEVKEKQKADKEKQQQEKEEHIKEKKKRLNRARKLKRRAKEREKKAGAAGDEGGAASGGDDSDGSE